MNSGLRPLPTSIMMLFCMIIVALALPLSGFGTGVQNVLNYQGLLTDPSGQPVPDGDYQLTLRLFNDLTGGSELWSDVETVASKKGRVELSTYANPIPLDLLSGVDATGTPLPLFLEVQVGSDPPLTPRSRLGGELYAGQARRLRGDIGTAPGQLVILDTLTYDTVFSMKASHAVAMASIRNTRAIAPSGDSTTVITSVDPQVASTKYYTTNMADANNTTTMIYNDSNKSSVILSSVDEMTHDTVKVNSSADSSGARVYGKTDSDSFFDITASHGGGGVTVGSANASLDTTIVIIDADTLSAKVSGKKKKSDFSVDSFFDITASDDGMVSTFGNADALTNDTDLVVIRLDSSGSSIDMRKKGDVKDVVKIKIGANNSSVPSADFSLLPGMTEGIALAADSGTGSGINVATAKKVVKFKAGASLANAVNKMNPPDTLKEGAYIALSGDLEQFVDITVDSLGASLLIGDTLLDSTLLLQTRLGGNGEIILKRTARTGRPPSSATFTPDTLIYIDTTIRHNMGRMVVDSNEVSLTLSQSGGGLPSTQVLIADVDGDGDIDMTVDGDIGIGTATPSNILTVKQGSATDPIADAWTTYSSRRWKKNIKPIEGALGKVEKLRGVTYDWKADGKHDIGLIAEEVGAVIPEIVAYEENGVDAKSVDYARLVALLIEGMKEQQSQLKSQHVKIDLLQSELAQVKSMVEQLAKRLEPSSGSQHASK